MYEIGELRTTVDREHLRLLSLCYLISAGLSTLVACLPILYASSGLWLAVQARPGPSSGLFGWHVFATGIIAAAAVLGFAALKFLAGRSIGRRRHLGLIHIAAGLCCLAIPYDTVLGVFTFLVLGRQSVASQFARPGAPRAERSVTRA